MSDPAVTSLRDTLANHNLNLSGAIQMTSEQWEVLMAATNRINASWQAQQDRDAARRAAAAEEREAGRVAEAEECRKVSEYLPCPDFAAAF
jgi:hypothetical protein